MTSDGTVVVEAVEVGDSAAAEDGEEIEEFLDSVKLKKHLPTFEECGYAFTSDLVNAEPEVSVAPRLYTLSCLSKRVWAGAI